MPRPLQDNLTAAPAKNFMPQISVKNDRGRYDGKRARDCVASPPFHPIPENDEW
jgi:hypothetical protein